MIYYYSLNQYLKDTFGKKLYKIALDAGFTCPNRDGKIDNRGCIFCSAGGSGDFASSRNLSITDQIEDGINRLSSKLKNKTDLGYIAYFQAFTNTYAPVLALEAKFMEAVNNPKILAISIATRPDCLPDEVLELLKRLNSIKPVWVELGLQTIHKESIDYIRRGYDNEIYLKAVADLKACGISHIVTHMIIGLPGENNQMICQTAKFIADSGVDGIKLQLLHIIKGTDLARDYEAGDFMTLEMEEYFDILEQCLERLPDKMVIHRLTGDGDKKTLIAPLWTANKKHVLNSLQKRIRPYPG